MEPEERKLSIWRIFALCAVGGAIDLGYAVEGAYAAPLMLDSGLPLAFTSIAFMPSPVFSLITQLFLGSVSDNCTCFWGRRRPFIVFFSILTVLSFILAPNSKYLLKANLPQYVVTIAVVVFIIMFDYSLNVLRVPSRAYVLDVLPVSQSQLGSFIYSAMIGIGATLGFILGGIDWLSVMKRKVSITNQTQVVFGLVAVVTLLCMLVNICSVKETPYRPGEKEQMKKGAGNGSRSRETTFNEDGSEEFGDPELTDELDGYFTDNEADEDNEKSSLVSSKKQRASGCLDGKHSGSGVTKKASCCKLNWYSSLKLSLVQILEFVYHMSRYMWLLLLFTFLVAILNSFENFFTVFVGRGVYKGDPDAPFGSGSLLRYNTGVRIGSWGLAIAAASDVVTSLVLSRVTRLVRLKTVFMWILALCVVSMLMMMAFQRVEVVLALSVFYGPMLGLAVTIPFALIPLYEVSQYLYTVIWLPSGRSHVYYNIN